MRTAYSVGQDRASGVDRPSTHRRAEILYNTHHHSLTPKENTLGALIFFGLVALIILVAIPKTAIIVPPQECITKDSIAAGAAAKRAELARARVSARGPDSSARSLPTDN